MKYTEDTDFSIINEMNFFEQTQVDKSNNKIMN